MMPQTVPKRPINGAAEPSVARNGSRASSRRISAFKVSRIARSIRSRRSPGVSGWGRGSAVLSATPAESTRPAGSPASVASSSCGERAAAARASWLSADRLAAPRRQSLSMITAQLHTEAASSSSKTPLTTGSAFRNSLTTERDAAGSFKMASALHFIRTSKPGLEARKCGAPAALESLCQPREESAARTELRGEHAQPRARTYLVYLIEQVDDIEAQLQPLVDPSLDRLDDTHIHLLVAGEGGPVRMVARSSETAAGDQVDGKAGVPDGKLVLYPSRRCVGLVVIGVNVTVSNKG